MNIRKKGKWKTGESKFVIEEDNKYLKTVPVAKELFEILCLAENNRLPSCSNGENKIKEVQSFVQSPLNESKPSCENETEKLIPTKEEFEAMAKRKIEMEKKNKQ